MVGKELHRLLNYEEIKNSPILSRFLEFVVDKKLSGLEDEIKEYTIGVKALGKPKDFNPQLDASVRIHAGRLRKILQDYYSGPGRDDTIHIDIPKGTYIPVFENSLVDKPGSPVHKNGFKHPEKNYIDVTYQPLKPILAVLPFHNLSSDNSKDYFVKGIGEQLSTDFARFQNISVVSYYSTDKYDIDLHDLQEMKKSANIDYALTGSVRFINDLVRLNVQLIQVDNGQIIFADTYSKHLNAGNIFDIQEELAAEILNVVAGDHGIITTNKPQSSTEDMNGGSDTQAAVYSYFNYTSEFDNGKYASTISSLEKAVAAEPQNPLTTALLASMYMYGYCTKNEYDEWLLQTALELSLAAVRLDPNCQHAQKALGWALLLSGKKEKSLEVIEHCIRLNPKASSVIALMALAYVCQGEYEEGFKWLLETTHLNPDIHG
ncbi:MAG: FlgO family outer membrane protein, partial [Flavisolibacter sp.]